jgi:Ca-activated chloride channel family protein
MMLELEFAWALVLLPLPALLQWWLPAYAERRQAIRAPYFEQLAALTGREPSKGAAVARGPRIQRVLVWVIWALLVAALARPVWIGEPIARTRAARDLMLALDLSGSMQTEDFTTASGERVDRLTAVKEVLDEFIRRREDDRLGLLLFGNAPFIQAPFTEDHETLRALLDEAAVGMAGPQTMLGDAIGLSITVFEEAEAEQRVLILLTDGNDTGSKVPPTKAAKIAAEHGITIHAIGAGDPGTTGEEAFDEATLKQVAESTGGRYFRAMDRAQLEQVYATLDELLPREVDSITHRPRDAIFWLPVAAVILLTLLYHLWRAVA